MASIERVLKLCFARLLTPNLNFSKNLQKSFLGALNLWILRFAQYDKFRLSPKFDSLPRFDFIKARNDEKMASFGVEFMNFYVNFRKNLKNSKNLQIF